MNCEELREYYDLYAWDIAEEPEKNEIRAHLNRGCRVCMDGVKQSLATALLMGSTTPEARPSPRLRRRILASVGAPARGGRILTWAAAATMAGLFLIAVSVIESNRHYAAQAVRLSSQLAVQRSEIGRLTEAFAILSGPGTTRVSFGVPPPRTPQGEVFVNPRQGVLLVASNLPRTPVHRVYEMWIIPKGSPPVAAGLFQSQDDGSAMHIRRGDINVASTAAIAVTVEDEAGASAPTTKPVIVASLPDAGR